MVQGECAAMNWREVRSRNGNKLLFRFCVETDQIEIKTPSGTIEVITLDDFRPTYQKKVKQSVDNQEYLCYCEVIAAG